MARTCKKADYPCKRLENRIEAYNKITDPMKKRGMTEPGSQNRKK